MNLILARVVKAAEDCRTPKAGAHSHRLCEKREASWAAPALWRFLNPLEALERRCNGSESPNRPPFVRLANRPSAIHNHKFFRGVLAQLVERLNGIEEVRGSNPLGSSLRFEARQAKAVTPE
jgi:hypothetical protein